MKPRFLPKFPVFVQDWLSSLRVRAMTLEERGAFLELLLLQWQEGSLPADPTTLLRIAGIHGLPADHPLLVEAFPISGNGLRRNGKCASVRDEAEAWCAEQARKSALGVAARKQPAGQPTGNPAVNPRSTPPTPTPTPNSDSNSESAPSGQKEARRRADLDPLEVLGEFVSIDRPEVQRALGEYLRGRVERRQKRQTPRGLRLGLRKLEPFGAAGAVQAIEEATQGGWLGFFEPKAIHPSNGKPRGLDAVRAILQKQGGAC